MPALKAPTPSKTEIRSTALPSGVRPAAIGPPETKIAGMLTRIAAISMPGTILSQLGMQTMASKQCASIIVSTQSAISSRDGREYFIPTCPMAIPSSTPMVLNSKGTPPAARTAFLDQPAEFLQMDMAGHDIDIGIDDGDKRFLNVCFAETHGPQQGTVRRPLDAGFDFVGT